MNDEALTHLIYRANAAAGEQPLVARPLTDTVAWARLWTQAPQPDATDAEQPNYYAYLIRDKAGRCIGVVVDQGEDDLHALMLPHRRGRGHMSQALREVILPHLIRQWGRTEQRITISRNFGQATFEAAERAARAVGFEPLELGEQAEEHRATLRYQPADPEALPWYEGRNTLPTAERVRQLRREVAYLASRLRIIGAEVELQWGEEDLAVDVDLLADDVLALQEKIERGAWAAAKREGRTL